MKKEWDHLKEVLAKSCTRWNKILKGNAYLEALEDTLKWMNEIEELKKRNEKPQGL